MCEEEGIYSAVLALSSLRNGKRKSRDGTRLRDVSDRAGFIGAEILHDDSQTIAMHLALVYGRVSLANSALDTETVCSKVPASKKWKGKVKRAEGVGWGLAARPRVASHTRTLRAKVAQRIALLNAYCLRPTQARPVS